MTSKANTIYALLDESNLVRYVGRSGDLKRRLRHHKSMRPWIKCMRVLQRCSSMQVERAEAMWVKFFKDCGHILENKNNGGGGLLAHTAETRAKISAAGIGRVASLETRHKMSVIMTGRIRSPEHKAALSLSLKGRVHSPETREKISRTNTGHTHTAETCAKIAAFQKGRTRTLEQRSKISLALTGHIVSTETRSKLRAILTGRKLPIETCKKMSVSAIARIKAKFAQGKK